MRIKWYGQEIELDPMKLVQARFEKDWPMTKLSAVSGVHRITIRQLELGYKTRPFASTIQKIAEALDVPIERFFK